MGIAFALGRAVVVIAPAGGTVPFDVGVEPVMLDGSSDAAAAIAAALEAAFFDSGFASDENTSHQTMIRATLRSRAWYETDHLQAFLKRLMEDGFDPQDPVQVEGALATLWGGDQPRPVFLTPAWPGTYPEEGARRCFHIMPFSKGWSGEASEAVKAACQAEGVEYDRGDMGEGEPRIRQEIWKKICRATHIVADITDHNPNVAFELGMAHTLGAREELILRQRGETHPPHRMISHIRYDEYDAEGMEMPDTLARFLH
jgi:hypothetical protein